MRIEVARIGALAPLPGKRELMAKPAKAAGLEPVRRRQQTPAYSFDSFARRMMTRYTGIDLMPWRPLLPA